MVRGQVVWVDLDPARGREAPKKRPAIVVSRATANARLSTITLVPLSSVRGRQEDRLVQPLLPRSATRLPKDSRALCDQVRTVDLVRVRDTGHQLTPASLDKIDRGLLLHLGIERNPLVTA